MRPPALTIVNASHPPAFNAATVQDETTPHPTSASSSSGHLLLHRQSGVRTAHRPYSTRHKVAPSKSTEDTEVADHQSRSLPQWSIVCDHPATTDLRVSSPLLSPRSRSRTSSRIKKNGRPGTAAPLRPCPLPSTASKTSLRRAVSLDDSILPSFRSRCILPGEDSPYQSCFSSMSPLIEPAPMVAVIATSPPSGILQPPITVDATDVPDRGAERWTKLWHTLMELLVTEKAYLFDLRMLVLVYLDQLPHHLQLVPGDIEVIRRNIHSLLSLHESHSSQLSRIEGATRDVLGSDVPTERKLEVLGRCLAETADLFITSFMLGELEVYQAYCVGHTEALAVVRLLQARPEWDAYEQRCSVLCTGPTIHEPAMRRRYSTESMRTIKAAQHPPLHISTVSRLKLMDFLIKPVQRICKYPLLLSQLRDAAETAGLMPTRDVDPFGRLELALEAMQTTARGVDDARKHKELTMISSLIESRMDAHHTLTQPFISSLGVCVLAGCLEVVYHHIIFTPLRGSVKARCYGAFLYPGYIILVKVKKGRIYEGRHWFPLHNTDVSVMPDSASLLPHSFRLSNGLHHFELSAHSSAEKDVWMDAVAQARAASPIDVQRLEAITSLHSPSNGSQVSLDTDEIALTAFLADPLPSPEERESVSLNDCHSAKDRQRQSTAGSSRGSSIIRRSSLFSMDPSNSVVRRPSSAHRGFVEKQLADVMSNVCLQARAATPMLLRKAPPSTDPPEVGRSRSWGKATSDVLGRTPSVSSVFYRRVALPPADDESVEGESPAPRSSMGGDRSPTRGHLLFPPVSVSLSRRRKMSTGTQLVMPYSDAAVAEADENSEGVGTPESTTFPLTPDAASYHDAIPPAGISSDYPTDPYHSLRRSPSPSIASTYKPSRSKSQSVLRNVRGQMPPRRESLPSMDDILKANKIAGATTVNSSALSNNIPSCEEPVPRSLLQRGMAYVLRKRTNSVFVTTPPRGSLDIQHSKNSFELQNALTTDVRRSMDSSFTFGKRSRVRSAPLEVVQQSSSQCKPPAYPF